MVKIRKEEKSNIVGHRKGVPLRVGGYERRSLLIELDFTVCFNDLRAVAGSKTARK